MNNVVLRGQQSRLRGPELDFDGQLTHFCGPEKPFQGQQ